MFSSKNFYDLIHVHLTEPLKLDLFHFTNFGSTSIHDLRPVTTTYNNYFTVPNFILAYDQEPIYKEQLYKLFNPTEITISRETIRWYITTWLETQTAVEHTHFYPRGFKVLANSEHSEEKNNFLRIHDDYHDWYYFYHGFAALDWYRNIAYDRTIHQFSKVFITFNNLYTKKRSYRLDMIARLYEKGIADQGYISMNPKDAKQQIKREILSRDSLLSKEARIRIAKTLLPTPPVLTIDTDNMHGGLSTEPALAAWTSALWHIVTETIYYDDKLHLTEKIFKPIVSHRPFILAAAPGNLAYLKSYGFRTFDRWIDESYDNEQDPDLRMSMIVAEVERLCKLSPEELQTMYNEMQEVLDHNFFWFYEGFKEKIVNELVDNFKRCLINHNAGRNIHCESYNSFEGYRDHRDIDFENVKRRLML
jgi:hypothetical protein